jgi:hypothetical protein
MVREVGIDDAIVAGWTGRDAAAVEKHIMELEGAGRNSATGDDRCRAIKAFGVDHGMALSSVWIKPPPVRQATRPQDSSLRKDRWMIVLSDTAN